MPVEMQPLREVIRQCHIGHLTDVDEGEASTVGLSE